MYSNRNDIKVNCTLSLNTCQYIWQCNLTYSKIRSKYEITVHIKMHLKNYKLIKWNENLL